MQNIIEQNIDLKHEDAQKIVKSIVENNIEKFFIIYKTESEYCADFPF